MAGQLQFYDLAPEDQDQSLLKSSSWRIGRVPPRSMKIIGPLGEVGVRQRVDVRRIRKSAAAREVTLAASELSSAEPYDRPASAPLLQPTLYRRKGRNLEGPSKQNLEILDRLHEESKMTIRKLNTERGPPLPIQTTQEWDSQHQNDQKEIQKLQQQHHLIEAKISAQADGITQVIQQSSSTTERHIDEIAILVTQHEKVLADTNAQHALALARVLETNEQQLAAERAKRHDEVAACHQKYTQLELDITSHYEHRISDITARYEERISTTAKYNEWQTKEQLNLLQSQVSQLHQEAEHEVDQMEGDAAERFQLQLKEMQRLHELQLEKISQEKAAELAVLRAEYEAKLDQSDADRGHVGQFKAEAPPSKEIEALERMVESLTEDVTRWRRCAEEASQAASNHQQELKVMEMRYDEMKLQLMQGTRDEVAGSVNEANHAAATWEQKFVELQSQYDTLVLQSSQTGQDDVQVAEDAVVAAKQSSAAAAYWEQEFRQMQQRYDELKLENMQGFQQQMTEENDLLRRVESMQGESNKTMKKLTEENVMLRKKIHDLEFRAASATPTTAATTPMSDLNRSLYSTPQPHAMMGIPRSSSTTPVPTQDPPRAQSSMSTTAPLPEDLPDMSGLSWPEFQQAMGQISTEELMRMTGRS